MNFNLGVTLARGGSKSIPKKNIVPLCGKPLIAYTIKEALKSSFLNSYIINTDCEEIAKTSRELDAHVQLGRPDHLSDDTAQSGHTLKYVVERFEEENNIKVKFVTEIMTTNPLKKAYDIDACIKLLINNNADSCIAMGRLYDHHPSRIKYINDEGIICDFYPEIPESRRQDLKPKAFIRAGSIYVMSRDQIKTGLRYGSGKSLGYILPDERFINIDEPRDLFTAEKIISEL